MIGQDIIRKQLENNLPRFSLVVGAKGSGKKRLINEVYRDKLLVYCGIKIESIREMIDTAYKVTVPTIYVLPDADGMSVPAKNALLKVVEEPPYNAYFIMTLEDEQNTLPTIRSRAVTYKMDRYTPEEILQYLGYRYTLPDLAYNEFPPDSEKIVPDICETPGEVNALVEYGILPFYEYVNKVIDNIAKVSGANAFKIADKVALKDEEDKYDLLLFWKAFIRLCANRADEMYVSAIPFTSKCIRDLRIRGVNKQMLFDKWLLEVRRQWM